MNWDMFAVGPWRRIKGAWFYGTIGSVEKARKYWYAWHAPFGDRMGPYRTCKGAKRALEDWANPFAT